MIQKVRVVTKLGPDLKGESILSDIRNILGLKNVTKVQTIKVYRLEGVNVNQAKILADRLLAESLNQNYSINSPIANGQAKVVEISYKSGVMNPEVASIMKSSSDLGIKLQACDTSYEYAFFGNLKREDVLDLVEKSNLYNKTVEQILEKDPQTLLIKGAIGKTAIILIRKMSDKQLIQLSEDKLFLNLEEMKAIQNYFITLDRDPTDLELETLAQTWSEHSGHKTFKADLIVDGKVKEPLLERVKKEALKHSKNIVSAFSDNSGVMDFYEGYGICGKVETHNSPSAIEPYGGAMTGSGGVFRDIAATGMGAKNIASVDIFCFAPLDLDSKDLPEGCLPSEYLLKRVVAGVRDYGNRIGIPTNNGSVHFHEDFRAKPSVIVGAYGIVPKKYALKQKPKIGDLIITVGGKTGRDGIHGATFSSAVMTHKTIETNSSAVQIGNAIEEKKMFDALLEARDEDLIKLVQDLGGGGFSSGIGEIGEDLGVSVDIKNAPLKYQGLAPWEIWVSESQERMVVVVDPKKLSVFESVCKKHNLEYTVLGKFDGSKKLNVTFGEEVVGSLDMEFLHHGLPKKILVARRKALGNRKKEEEPKALKTEKEWIDTLKKVLAHGNVASKEPIVRLYDHSVGGTNDLQPFSGVMLDGPNDAPILRPILNKKYGMIIAHGLNPVLGKIDPYWGGLWAGVEALSNYVAVGGDYKNSSLIENFIFPFPDEETLWDLDRSVDSVIDLMKTFKIPVISGKDSLSSTYRGQEGNVIKIPPTLCISVFGKIPDTSKTVTADFKKVGSTVVLVGKMDESLGGSTFYNVNGVLGNDLPKVDLKTLPKTFDAVYKGINVGKILSCHDVSEGGVIGGLFEMCVGGDCGIKISQQTDKFLFNETAGMFLVEVENEKIAKSLFKNISYKIIGKTQTEKVILVEKTFNADLEQLKEVWKEPMRRLFS